RSLMFGPFAGFSTNFLKSSSFLDLPKSIRPHNLWPMLNVAKDNFDLVGYLVSEVTKSHGKKVDTLRNFFPEATDGAWELITAGQPGASPGASTAAPIMVELLRRSFPTRFTNWESKLTEMIPSLGQRLNENPELLAEVTKETTSTLKLG